jgi:3-methyladenine DNA glycosylase AlkD
MSSDNGDVYATRMLAECYIRMDKKNHHKAIDIYKKLAEQGDKDALLRLGDCYKNGIGVKKNEADFLERKVKPLLKSQKEFETRTGLVCLLDLFMGEEYLLTIYESIESLKDRDEYYVKMAIAWLLTECYIKFPNKTEVFMNRTELNNWTFNKAISKICDSYRVSIEDKDKLRKMRKS